MLEQVLSQFRDKFVELSLLSQELESLDDCYIDSNALGLFQFEINNLASYLTDYVILNGGDNHASQF